MPDAPDGQDEQSHEPVDPRLAQAAAKLQEKYAHGNGPLSDEEVLEAIEDAAGTLRDAPVQTFVPLIAENLARDRLRDRVDDVTDDGDPAPELDADPAP